MNAIGWQRRIVQAAQAAGWSIAELNEYLLTEYGRRVDQLTDRQQAWMIWKDLCHLRDFQEWRRHRIVVEDPNAANGNSKQKD